MIYHGMQAEGGGDVKRAVRLALGGPVLEYNGKKVAAPAQFENGPDAAGGPASVWTIGLIDPPDAFESSRP